MNNLFTLSTALETATGTKHLTELGYFNKLREHWDVVVGKGLANKTSPIKLVRKTLYILVEDSAYAQHLSYFTDRLLDLIASPAVLGEGKVLKIRFRTGDQEKTAKAPEIRNEHKEHLNTLKKEELEKVTQASSKIQDLELRAVFASYMTIVKRRRNET